MLLLSIFNNLKFLKARKLISGVLTDKVNFFEIRDLGRRRCAVQSYLISTKSV